MTSDQMEQVHSICEQLWTQIHDTVDHALTGVDPEVQDLVRLKMTEQFRFWKRMSDERTI